MSIYYHDLLVKADDETGGQINVSHPILDRSRPMVMMTADYPMVETNDPNPPKYTTEGDLANDLKRNGIQFELTKGKYSGKNETSVIAYDMPPDLAHELAKKYRQESYVHIEPNGMAKLRYSGGQDKDDPNDNNAPFIPLEGRYRQEVGTPKVFDHEPENNFTYVPSLGKYVSLDFDWSTPPSQLQTFKGETTMKNEYTIGEVKAEIANLLKKHLNEYEESLIELRKSDHKGQLPHNPKEERQIKEIASSYEKKGKSPEQSKAIAYATVNAQHKAESCTKCGKSECECKSMHKSMACKKCGTMMKGETCSKCGEMSAGTKKNEAVSMMEKKGDKSAKGPQETPDKTKEAAKADGSGGDVAKGKLGKAEEDIKLMLGLELLFKAEESSSKEETSEETSSPERGSHEETPEEEESEAKKSVHNMKGEMAKGFKAGEMKAPPGMTGDKAPEHASHTIPSVKGPSTLEKIKSAASKLGSSHTIPGSSRVGGATFPPNKK
jgi:ribosomal protein L29